jgi:outer membrane protein assembly factor BamD (BamD/ComL family)
MEISGMKTALVAGFCLFAIAPCYGTGGDSYEYPATLSETLDMLPGKSLGEIFLETSTIKPPAESWDADKLRELADRIGKEPAPQLLKAADDLIAQARAAYTPGSDSCNLAHDVRDAIAVSAENPAAARDYIQERLNGPLQSDELAKHAESVTGAIKANWLYAAGAKKFSSGDRTDCVELFDRVATEFPKHPRAEIALFMSARCAFSATRAVSNDSSDDSTPNPELVKLRKTAIAKFEALRKKYPHGRFDADALGWLGALAFDSQDYLKALDYYIAQAESPGHPETLMSAIYNTEKTLAHLAPKPGGDAAFALIARHPRIAMAFTYLVLSAPEADNYDGKWDNPSEVRKWRRTILPRIAAAVVKQKDGYKSNDWQPRYLAMLVHAASASGNHAQAIQLSGISADQLNKSDDLLFARAVALQRAGKTREAIDAFQIFLSAFPKSRMAPGVKIRLALALQDNHQAGEAIATLRSMLAANSKSESANPTKTDTEESENVDEDSSSADEDSNSEEETSEAQSNDENESHEEAGATGWGPLASSGLSSTRYMSDSNGYPIGEREWNARDSAAYDDMSGADQEQINQFIDTLLNFAPLSELLNAPDDKNLDDTGKRKVRAILGERYLASENFAEAKKYIVDPQAQDLIKRLEQLTADNSGTPQEKAERMSKIGDLWAESRPLLLRAPLDTEMRNEAAVSGLLRRDNGHTLGMHDVEDQLDDRDELHHATRWWMRAARAVPGTPLSAEARLKVLEALPKIARVSLYTEQRARDIKLESVSREIYDKLRAESPNSPEAQRFAAYWSLPALPKKEEETARNEGPEFTPLVICNDDAAPLGYPYSANNAFNSLDAPSKESTEAEQERYRAKNDLENRIKALRGSATASEAKDLAALVRKNITEIEDATTANCLDDLAQFLSESGVTPEASAVYTNLRLDLLHRTRWSDSVVDPGISVSDSDDAVAAEIDRAEKNPVLNSFHDYLAFCRIGLIAGHRIDVTSNIPSSKEPDGTTYHSRDFPEIEKLTRDLLAKYPKSHKREAAMFVLARSIYSLSCPYIFCVDVEPSKNEFDRGDSVQKSYSVQSFDSKRVMQALDDYDREFPKGRYADDIRDMRAATFWRMGQFDKALDLTLAQLADKTKGDLIANAETRLANIFAELANVERRPQLLEIIRARPASIPYLALYVAAATNDRSHPLRYLQRYLSDQLHFKIPEPPPGREVAVN